MSNKDAKSNQMKNQQSSDANQKKYQELFQQVNDVLAEFNTFLKDDFQIDPLDLSKMDDGQYFLSLETQDWDSDSLPGDDDNGLYFYAASSPSDANNTGLLLGNSLGSDTEKNPLGKMNDKLVRRDFDVEIGGEPYHVEVMTSIPFDTQDKKAQKTSTKSPKAASAKLPGQFAPALEEFLKSRMTTKSPKNKVDVLNSKHKKN